MSIEVHVRLRPQDPPTVAWSTAETVLYNVAQPETRYVFHKVHPLQHTTNHSIFRGVEPIVLTAFENHQHVSLLAYGPTGSGKTHSMSGTSVDYGIIQRTTRLLVKLASTHPGTTLGVSFLEVYNECVRDLLDPSRGNGDLALQDALDGSVRVDKKVVPVESVGQFEALEKMAEKHRCYGVTDLNAHSSRSHVMITFEVRRRRRTPEEANGKVEKDEKVEEEGDGGVGGEREGKNAYVTHLVHLVDLAGAECAGKAKTEGQSLREGGFINKSLLALGNVVDALVERRPHIPYRDAKLTRLLRSALGGTGYTFILCCIHPGKENVEQTTSALRFAQRAMRLKRDPVVVLPIPPLFTHQYAIAATSLLQSASYSADLAYQRGLKDAFFYCDPTMSSVVQHVQSEVGDSLRALAGMQRLLLAQEHATALELVGERYHQRETAKVKYEEALVKRRAAQDQLERLQQEHRRRVEEVREEEQALVTLQNELDATLAEWEYKLHDAQRQRVTPWQLLMKKEEEDRLRVEYEWCVCVERIGYGCLQQDHLLSSLLQGGKAQERPRSPEGLAESHSCGNSILPIASSSIEAGDDPMRITGTGTGGSSSTSRGRAAASCFPAVPLPEDWRENHTWKTQWAEKIQHERRAVLELEAARGLLQERRAVSSTYGGRNDSETTWRGTAAKNKKEDDEDEEEEDDSSHHKDAIGTEGGNLSNDRGPTSPSPPHGVQGLLALDAQLEALGVEEQRLRRMLLFNTHRYSLRRIRSSTSEASLSSLSTSPSQHRSSPPPLWQKKREDDSHHRETVASGKEGWKRTDFRRHPFEQVNQEEEEEEEEEDDNNNKAKRERPRPPTEPRSRRPQRRVEEEEDDDEERRRAGVRYSSSRREGGGEEGGGRVGGRLRQTAPAVPIHSGGNSTSPFLSTPPLPSTTATTSSSSSSAGISSLKTLPTTPSASPTEVLRAAPRASPVATRRISSPTPLPLSHPLRAKERGGTTSTAAAVGSPSRMVLPSSSSSSSSSLSRPPLVGDYSSSSSSTTTTAAAAAPWIRRATDSPLPSRTEDVPGHTIHVYHPHSHRSRSRSETGGGGGDRRSESATRGGSSRRHLETGEEREGSSRRPPWVDEKRRQGWSTTGGGGGGGGGYAASMAYDGSTPSSPSWEPLGAKSTLQLIQELKQSIKQNTTSASSLSASFPSSSTTTATTATTGVGRGGSSSSGYLSGASLRSPAHLYRRSTSSHRSHSRTHPPPSPSSSSPTPEESGERRAHQVPSFRTEGYSSGGSRAEIQRTREEEKWLAHSRDRSPFQDTWKERSGSPYGNTAVPMPLGRPAARGPSSSSSSSLAYDTNKSSYRDVKKTRDENGVSPLLQHHQNTILGHRSSSSSEKGNTLPLRSAYYSSEREQKIWKRAE